jgi:hypothetical protein
MCFEGMQIAAHDRAGVGRGRCTLGAERVRKSVRESPATVGIAVAAHEQEAFGRVAELIGVEMESASRKTGGTGQQQRFVQ